MCFCACLWYGRKSWPVLRFSAVLIRWNPLVLALWLCVGGVFSMFSEKKKKNDQLKTYGDDDNTCLRANTWHGSSFPVPSCFLGWHRLCSHAILVICDTAQNILIARVILV